MSDRYTRDLARALGYSISYKSIDEVDSQTPGITGDTVSQAMDGSRIEILPVDKVTPTPLEQIDVGDTVDVFEIGTGVPVAHDVIVTGVDPSSGSIFISGSLGYRVLSVNDYDVVLVSSQNTD